LAQIGVLVEAGKVKPLVSDQRVSTQEIAAAHGLVESGSLGKVVVDI
jgi:NADPH:quinone reductase-like Zn-dependent oxidoreductase